ncbi:hypothetical protein AAVH_10669 [Aphelenchoides avenae]|nr:hypothetical protein AAVH_10667 [Aphelenchus avenae]KAH7721822.1 hypothetical protein AAVH_10669 [Aphelenchus avenae]
MVYCHRTDVWNSTTRAMPTQKNCNENEIDYWPKVTNFSETLGTRHPHGPPNLEPEVKFSTRRHTSSSSLIATTTPRPQQFDTSTLIVNGTERRTTGRNGTEAERHQASALSQQRRHNI